jgi:hypothetical protein
MLRLTWKQKSERLGIFLPSGDYCAIPCSCVVRDLEENKWRKKNQVVKTIPGGYPYNPKIFPVGIWIIGRPRPIERTEAEFDYKEPYYIPTDARQKVDVWALDNAGNYDHKTKKQVTDKAYGLHFSKSGTTLGCIKIESRTDLLFLVNIIQAEISKGNVCKLEVMV